MSHNVQTEIIEPDLKFAKDVIGMGGTDMERCYQCATCSVVCPLSPDDSPFPRREMIWAQWGLKDRLMKDPGVFLCHQCGDCSAYCPRDAKPADTISAIRAYAYRHYATPGFMGKMLSESKYLPLLVIFPIVLFAAILAALNTGAPEEFISGILPANLSHISGEFHTTIFPGGKIVFAHMYPHLGMIDLVFILTSLFVAVSLFISVRKFWAAMKQGQPGDAVVPVAEAVMQAGQEFISHKKFNDCGVKKDRALPHQFLFYSFLTLFIVTMFVAGGFWVFDVLLPVAGVENAHNPMLSPLEFAGFEAILKIAAIIGGAILTIGIALVIAARVNDKDNKMNASYSDWFFIGVILTVAVSGMLSWIFRIANAAVPAYSVYFAHLVSVFCLIAYLPFSKFAHIVYRFTAIVYAKHTGSDAKIV